MAERGPLAPEPVMASFILRSGSGSITVSRQTNVTKLALRSLRNWIGYQQL